MLRVLLIDDSPDTRLLVIRQLKKEFLDLEVEQIRDAQSFAQALANKNFDLAIIDYQLFWSDGLTVLQDIKSVCPDCPVVMFTNSATQEVAVEAMKAGLDDYVVKSSQHYVRLIAAVNLALERAEQRRKSQELEIRLHSLLNRLNVGVFRSTLDGYLLEANATFLEFLGVKSLAEAQVHNLHQILFPLTEKNQVLEKLQQQGQVSQQQIQLQKLDGSITWVSWNVILTQEEGSIFVDGLVEDITERKRFENIQKRNAQHLEEAIRLKDEFLATLSHELRTPLNSILGWSNILSKKFVDQNMTRRGLEAITRSAKTQLHLVEDLLDTAHVIKGNLQLEVSPTDISAVIASALKVVRPAAEAKEIHIDVKIDLNARFVSGDVQRLQQIVWNLLFNAIKFTPNGGRVEICLQKSCDLKEEKNRYSFFPLSMFGNSSAKYVQLKISDNGIGINKDFLPHIFDRFRQEDGSITRRFGGLGLGLAIVRYLVELHGGRVWAESPGEGKGATFIVELPIGGVQAKPEYRLPSNHAVSDIVEIIDTDILKGIYVLVVEDEADSRELLDSVLKIYGAQVTSVASVAAALDIMSHSIPDVLLSDIYMPEEDGYDLIRKVKQLAENKGIQTPPVVAISSYAQETERQQIIEAGFNLYMSKPIVPDELVGAIAILAGRDG